MLVSCVRKFGRVFAVVLLTLGLLSCDQGTTDEEYLARARGFMDQGDLKSSTIELKNALRQNDKNTDARLLLAQLYFEWRDFPSSEKELQKLQDVDSGADKNVVMPLLAKVWIIQGRTANVFAMSLEGLEPDALATILAAQAIAYLSQSDMKSAARQVDLALEMDPNSVYALNAKASLLFMQGELPEADEILSDLHQRDARNAIAWSLHADIKQAQGDFETAEEYYGKAMELDEAGMGYRLKRAFLRIRTQQYPSAQEDVDILLEFAPQSTQINYAQGLIHFYAKRYEEAVSAFVVAEPDKFSFPVLLLYLALSHNQLGTYDRAYFYAQNFYAIEADNPVGNRLLSSLWVTRGKPFEAEQLLRTVLLTTPNDIEAMNILANALIAQARVDEAIEVLARVVEIEPDSAAAQVRLGAGYVHGGRSEEAVELIQSAIELNPEYSQGDIILTLTHLKEKDYERALEAALRYRDREPTSATPLLLIARVHIAKGDTKAARESLQEVLELEPGNPSANHSLAALAYAQQDLDAARGFYRSVLDENPHFLSTLVALAVLEGSDQHFDKMVAYLEEAIANHPAALQPRVALARFYLGTGRSDKVPLAFLGLLEDQSKMPLILRLTARGQLEEAKYADARYSLELLIELEQTRATAADYHLLALAYRGLGNQDKLRSHLKKSLSLDPENVQAHLAMAAYAFSQANGELLEQHLTAIVALSPDHPQLRQLQAAYARVQGNQEEALKLFRQIHESSPTTGSLLNLHKQYELAGQEAAARDLLGIWVEGHSDDKSARMVLASKYMAMGDRGKMIEEYSALLALDKDNVVALNNLAWALKEDEPKQALAYAQHAADIAKNSPTILDTLALVQSANELHLEAGKTIREALKSDEDNPVFLYHSALIASAAGRREEAISILEALLDEVASFEGREEASELLESLTARE